MCNKKIETKLKPAFNLSSSVVSPIEEKQKLPGQWCSLSKNSMREKGLKYCTLSYI